MTETKPRCFCLSGFQNMDLVTPLFPKVSYFRKVGWVFLDRPKCMSFGKKINSRVLASSCVQKSPGCSHYSKEKPQGIKQKMKRRTIYSQLLRSLKSRKPKPAADTNQQPTVSGTQATFFWEFHRRVWVKATAASHFLSEQASSQSSDTSQRFNEIFRRHFGPVLEPQPVQSSTLIHSLPALGLEIARAELCLVHSDWSNKLGTF